MAEPLSAIERKVYHYLLDFLAENTYQPSVRDIGKRFRIKSTKTVSDVLQALADKGYIERDPSRSRGVRLIGFSSAGGTQPVPVVRAPPPGDGDPRTGEPPERWITVDRRYVPADDAFYIRMTGDSMSGRGILSGDFVLVNPSARANDGDTIAARIGDHPTIRTLTHRGATIVLEPANADEREIVIGPDDDFAVLGVVCGVYRPMFERTTPIDA
jgi:repressor LexA